MAGTKAGGIKAREANYKKHGKDFYKRIGKKGGQNGHTGGFAANPALAREAGAKGGKISRRGFGENAKKLNQHAEKIIELIDSGVYYTDIAKLYEVPYSTFTSWRRKELGE